MPTTVARIARDERGFALIVVLGVVALIGFVGAGAIAFATQGVEGSQNMAANQTAQELADSGLEAARAQIASSPQASLYDDDGDEWRAGGGKALGDEAGGEYAEVRIVYDAERSAASGAATYAITSTGHAGSAQRRLAASAVWGAGADGI